MRRNGNSVRKWGFLAVLAAGLICGTAYAASASATVPGSGDFTVHAMVMAGIDGGTVYSIGGKQSTEESVKFSIGGEIVVHGEICGMTDIHAAHAVEMSYYEIAGLLFVDTTVTDIGLGLVVAQDLGRMVERPDSVSVESELASISVE